MKKKYVARKMLTLYVLVLLVCIWISLHLSQAVTVMVETATVENRKLIIIDAGHGGIDGGATSCTGVAESQLNLDIALRLDNLLHLLGHRTLLLRDTDTSLHTEGKTISAQKISDLKNRVSTVNQAAPALLVSIHQNTFPDPRYHGAQVFYNQNPASAPLAAKMQDAFIQTVNQGSHRKAKPAQGVYLMQHVQCPAVLVECGFLTNPEEENKLRSAEYQHHLCCVISTVIHQQLDEWD